MFRKLAILTLLACTWSPASAQKTNPNNGINWPLATGSGAPASTCTAASTGTGQVAYGTYYLNIASTPNVLYMCGEVSGSPAWVQPGGNPNAITALTGDGTAAGPGSVALTLATVYSTPGCQTVAGLYWCVNAKGLTTTLGTPFSVTMTACSACGLRQAGNATSSPATFTLSYAGGSPTGASINDGAGGSDTLSSPYTAGSISKAYCQVSDGVRTFTFTVSATTTGQSAGTSNGTNCSYLTFAGAAGSASGPPTTASANSATTVSLSGTTVSYWNYAQETGSYTFATLTNQYACFVLHGAGHTFTFLGSPVTFSSTSLGSWANYYGFSQAMTLYCSPTYYSATNLTFGVN